MSTMGSHNYHTRPDEKMSPLHNRGRLWPITSVQRSVLKHVAARKRRQRDS